MPRLKSSATLIQTSRPDRRLARADDVRLAVKDAEIERQHDERRRRRRPPTPSARAGRHQRLDFQVLERPRCCVCWRGGARARRRRTACASEKPPMRLMATIAISAASRNSARRKLRRGRSAQKLRSAAVSAAAAGVRFMVVGRQERGEAYPRDRPLTNPIRRIPTAALGRLGRAVELAHLEPGAGQAAEGVQLGRRDQVDARAGAGIGVGEAEGDRLAGGAAVVERELQVVLARPRASPAPSRPLSANSGSRLATPNGARRASSSAKPRSRSPQRHLGVDRQRRRRRGRAELAGRLGREGGAERRRARRSRCSCPAAPAWPPNLVRWRAQRGQRLEQVDARRPCAPSPAPPRRGTRSRSPGARTGRPGGRR